MNGASQAENRSARVLIVEDDPDISAIMATYLSSAGFETLCVYDGVTALNVMIGFEPDLVFLDLRLPRLDGRGVLDRLTGDATPNVILVTAQSEEALHMRRAGLVQDVLFKPFDPNDAVALAVCSTGGPVIKADV